jgi:hypothetical protein
MLRRVRWYKFTDVSEVPASSIIRVSDFILNAVRNWNLTEIFRHLLNYKSQNTDGPISIMT